MNEQNQLNGGSLLSAYIVFIAFSYTVYSCIISIFGVSAPSWVLRGFAAFVMGSALIAYLITLRRYKWKIGISEGLILISVIAIIAGYYISNLRYGPNESAKDTIQDFLARSIPGVLVGIVAAKRISIKKLSQGLDVVLVIFAICSSKILFLSIINRYSPFSWDVAFKYNYQPVSYMAAYAVGISIYECFIERKFKNNLIRIFYIYVIIVCSTLALYSGGRGGVLLCTVFLIGLLAYYAFVEKRVTKLISALILSILAVGVGFYYLADNKQFLSSFTRSFQYINSSGGINWEGTSGREEIYLQSIELIKKSPIWGYGITGAPRNGVARVHNIFLELYIDGGIIYFLIWISLFVKFFIFCIKRLREGIKEYALLIVLYLSDFVLLSVSGVYMRTTIIWFTISYVLVKSSKKYNEECENEHFNIN